MTAEVPCWEAQLEQAGLGLEALPEPVVELVVELVAERRDR